MATSRQAFAKRFDDEVSVWGSDGPVDGHVGTSNDAEMFSHVMLGTNDIDRAKKFYDPLFAALGGKPGRVDPKGRLMYLHKGAVFMLSLPIDGETACHANGGTIGFAVESPEQGNAWHAAGVENGGTPIEDPPGVREGAISMYLAYLRDPDGNKLCALKRM